MMDFPEGFFYIKSRLSNKVVDVDGASLRVNRSSLSPAASLLITCVQAWHTYFFSWGITGRRKDSFVEAKIRLGS